MPLTLTKTITVTLTAEWCRYEFLPMTPEFRRQRRGLDDPMDKCFLCGHRFKDGEMMSLARIIGQGGNRILCQECAGELLASQEVTEGAIE